MFLSWKECFKFELKFCAESKKQTLANLANFAYDPINYDFIKQLHLTDLFLAQLTGTRGELEAAEELVYFAIGGIVNLCCGKFFTPM